MQPRVSYTSAEESQYTHDATAQQRLARAGRRLEDG